MHSVVLLMWRDAIARGLMMEISKGSDVRPYYEQDYSRAADAVRHYGAKALIIEAAEQGQYNMSFCLEVLARLKKEAPSCSLFLMCPEQDNAAIGQAVRAKHDEAIDDFVFSESSIVYVASMLLYVFAV